MCPDVFCHIMRHRCHFKILTRKLGLRTLQTKCRKRRVQNKLRKRKKGKRAIVAALRNSSNGGIRITDRNDGSPLTSQANDFHLSKKKSCVSEKSNSKKNNKSVKGATKRSKMSKMASRDTNDVDPTDGDFSAEEDAHDFSEDDEIIPNSYSHGSRKNPTSNESHKSTKEGGSTKSKIIVATRMEVRVANRAKSKGPLIEEESEGDSSDEDAAINSDEESESDEDDPSTKESHQSSKTPRGLCRSKVMATDRGCKLTVTFNAIGQPVGENSDKFSSYLGSIASEMVPLTYSDWRAIRKGYKDLYWQSVLMKGAELMPSNKLEAEEPKVSRYEGKLNQELPHTCSRQGYARLEYQMQKESPNPSSITRVDVWCKGHTKKSGEPSNNIVAERMKKMKEIRDSATSDSFNHSIQNDALSQVLGLDRYSRVRGKGAGVTPSKLGVVSQDKQMVTQLQEEVLTVKKDLVQMANLVNTQSELIRNLLTAVNTQKASD
ncbi:hypothetical protein IFM89_012185 [Coptis chinensis]|uniref:Uncharacterized protein n=1 Tax=Coptis chinensis TaxID=261450 RepID=A0A835HKR6_9MAGN|nr:hypothetical protein IFM89_012185 [Coptis chinensis]